MTNALQMAKAEVRMEMVDRRALMQPDVREASSNAIVERVASSEVFQRATSYCGFVSMREEVQVMPLAEKAADNGCTVFLPAFDEVARIYRFRVWNVSDPLHAGRWNILEPAGESFSVPEGDVCIIVPGLGFDRSGARIGYGGGYYDRMLHETRAVAGSRVTAIGVAYAFQLLDAVPHAALDQPVDMVATESEWIRTHKQGG